MPEDFSSELITGENYDSLEPGSIEVTSQDEIDDSRFGQIEYKHLINLPNHQERMRAARAMGRRGDHLCKCEEDVESTVNEVEFNLRKRNFEGRILGVCWLVALFFGINAMFETGFFGGIFAGFIVWWLTFGIIVLGGIIWNLDPFRKAGSV